MARQVKCQYCEDKVDKDMAYIYKKRNYHIECFEQWKQEKNDRENLYKYICEIFRIDFPTGLMAKQIKTYSTEQGYKYKGMELALKYFFDTLGNRPQEGQGIGIIPYVYEDAKQHYIKQQKIAKSINNDVFGENSIMVHINTNTTREKKRISIEAL